MMEDLLKQALEETLPIWAWETCASAIPKQRVGNFRIKKKPIRKLAHLSMGKVFGYEETLFLADVDITVLEERHRGKWRVWMSDSPQEYFNMWELSARVKGRVLVGGLGLGILVNLLSNRRDVTEIVVVEKSKEIIRMVKPYLPQNVTVIEGDFFQYLNKITYTKEPKNFDAVIVDTFTGEKEDDEEMLEDAKNMTDDYTCSIKNDCTILFWKYQKEIDADLTMLTYYSLKAEEERKKKEEPEGKICPSCGNVNPMVNECSLCGQKL